MKFLFGLAVSAVVMSIGTILGWHVRAFLARWRKPEKEMIDVIDAAIDVISLAKFSRGAPVATVPNSAIDRLAKALAALNGDGHLIAKVDAAKASGDA